MFGIDRTPNKSDHVSVDVDALLVDAFDQLGVEARRGRPGEAIDLALDLGGVTVPLEVQRRSLVDDDFAKRLHSEHVDPNVVLLVVADRVTDAGRKVLTTNQIGYYDLRGHLALRARGVVIEADVAPLRDRPERESALSGRAGVEVATALLLNPGREGGVRALARELGRSPSTVSEILHGLRRDGLVDDKNVLTGTDLFWQVAERWSVQRFALTQLPMPGDEPRTRALRLGIQDVEEEGWALTDSAAAAMFGAPVAFRTAQVLDFYVPDKAVVRRAMTLLGAATSRSQARATVAVAPVPAVVQHRINLSTNLVEWPLAHPLFVALDLAQDVGRGRAILADWTPDERWTRVW